MCIPDMSQITTDEKAGVATALKKLAERRFVKFGKEIKEIIEKTYYDEEEFKLVQDLKKETEEFTDK